MAVAFEYFYFSRKSWGWLQFGRRGRGVQPFRAGPITGWRTVQPDNIGRLKVRKQRRLDETIDRLRARYGRKVVYFGNVQESREAVPTRISFTHIPDLELEQD
jgi:hypothetical protein